MSRACKRNPINEDGQPLSILLDGRPAIFIAIILKFQLASIPQIMKIEFFNANSTTHHDDHYTKLPYRFIEFFP